MQELYPKSVRSAPVAPLRKVRMLSSAANAVVDADLAVTPIRKRQVWKLLPTVAVLNMKVGWTAASVAAPPSLFFPQYVVTPALLPCALVACPTLQADTRYVDYHRWFGKNSKSNGNRRKLGELAMHMNFRITGGQQGERMSGPRTTSSKPCA